MCYHRLTQKKRTHRNQDYIRFMEWGCMAAIGKKGNANKRKTHRAYVGQCDTHGSIAHEIMHILGTHQYFATMFPQKHILKISHDTDCLFFSMF